MFWILAKIVSSITTMSVCAIVYTLVKKSALHYYLIGMSSFPSCLDQIKGNILYISNCFAGLRAREGKLHQFKQPWKVTC